MNAPEPRQRPIVFTAPDLEKILPRCDAGAWIGPLNTAMAEFALNTPARIAMFVAQCGHESYEFNHLEESLNYSAEGLMRVFSIHFRDRREAAIFAFHAARIANRVYSNRLGNGDENSGDGWTYRGRGLIQITGRKMYQLAGEALKADLVNNPELLMNRDLACRSAAWFFTDRMPGIPLADAKNLEGCTRRINGGLTGIEQRRQYYQRACQTLGVNGVNHE